MGAILTGVFATASINPIFKDASGQPLPVGLIDGNGAQIINQLIAVAITIAMTVVGSYVLLKIVDLVIGLRVSEAGELQGLDISEHGEGGLLPVLIATPATTALGDITPATGSAASAFAGGD